VPAAAVVCSGDYAVAAQRELTPDGVSKVHLGAPVGSIVRRRGCGAALRGRLEYDGSPLVGIVGRLEEWKGQDLFLHAAARIADRHPAARFAIVGGAILGSEGSYPLRLRELTVELGIDDRVHFSGHVDDVFPWFDAFDVCVHATAGEPFGLVLVEAMALGTPLVATALGGPVEIVEDGRSGLLVAPGCQRALAEAVDAILGDAALAARLSTGGSRRAWRFTEERMAAGFADVLRRVLT
jgi:glycosyltransferase involved in cell wall biosynthesis